MAIFTDHLSHGSWLKLKPLQAVHSAHLVGPSLRHAASLNRLERIITLRPGHLRLDPVQPHVAREVEGSVPAGLHSHDLLGTRRPRLGLPQVWRHPEQAQVT